MTQEVSDLNENEKKVIGALNAISAYLSQHREVGNNNPVWIKTRDIAERCDINIYKARYFLLKLEDKGLVFHQISDKKSPLCWRITKEIAPK